MAWNFTSLSFLFSYICSHESKIFPQPITGRECYFIHFIHSFICSVPLCQLIVIYMSLSSSSTKFDHSRSMDILNDDCHSLVSSKSNAQHLMLSLKLWKHDQPLIWWFIWGPNKEKMSWKIHHWENITLRCLNHLIKYLKTCVLILIVRWK